MSADPNWERWVFASISDHFNTVITAAMSDAKMYVEGADKTNDDPKYFEFRMDGPYLRQISRNFWEIWVNVNILCIAKRDGTDFHTIHRMAGVASSAFSNSISVLKFGSG